MIPKASPIQIIRATLQERLRAGRISLSDIRSMAEQIRAALDLDMVYALSNVEYQYQMDGLFSTESNRVKSPDVLHIQLDGPLYRHIVEGYAATPVATQAIPGLCDRPLPCQLHKAILHEGEYYGTVGFANTTERRWSEEEKIALDYLGVAVLFHLSLTHLAWGNERDRRVKDRLNDDTVLSCYLLDLSTEQCHIVKSAPFLDEPAHEWMPYRQVAGIYAQRFTDPTYRKSMADMFDLDCLRENLSSKSPNAMLEMQHEEDGEATWLRCNAEGLQFAEDGAPLRALLSVQDISAQKAQERKLEETRRALQAELKRASERELQLSHDPLTGAFNRTGYQRYLETLENCTDPVGYLMIDVDHFKEINDTFGHEAGDQALVSVVKLLKQAFRTEDKVFRMGGDEFVVILEGCKENAWDSIRHKLRAIHVALQSESNLQAPVTLSVGLAISPDGFRENLASLADDALYITKRNGRAGMTQVNAFGDLVKSWNDDAVSEDEFFERSDMGKWRYVCPLDGSAAPQLFLDEPGHFILGIPDSLSPEECYERWVAAIPEQQRGMLDEMKDKTSAVGQAESTHSWTHPTLGPMHVHTRVRWRGNKDVQEFVGHFVAIKDEGAVLSPSDTQFVIQAMNNACFHTYYVDLETGSFIAMKGLEGTLDSQEGSIREFADRLVVKHVHPDFRERVAAFMDPETLPERLRGESFIDCDYLSLTKYGWCRSRFLPVKWNKEGEVTHVLLNGMSIDSRKRRELERTKRATDSLKLQLRVGEMVSKAPLLQTAIINKQTGALRIWADALFDNEGVPYDFETAKKEAGRSICAEDRTRFQEEFTLKSITDTVERTGSCTLTFHLSEADGSTRTITQHFETLPGNPQKLLLAVEDVSALAPEDLQEVQQELANEKRLMECIKRMMVLKDPRDCLTYLLGQMARFYNGDRVTLARVDKPGRTSVMTEYCNKGNRPRFKVNEPLPDVGPFAWNTVEGPVELLWAFCTLDQDDARPWLEAVGISNLMTLCFPYGNGRQVAVSIDNVSANEHNHEWVETLAFFIAKELEKLSTSGLPVDWDW